MVVRWFLSILFGATFALAPVVALADLSATVAALAPSDTVGVGTRVTFSLILSGFTNPTFYLVDSFPGGAVTFNLDSSGNFAWTPTQDDIGTHTITVTITDATTGAQTTASKTITVVSPMVSMSAPSPSSNILFGNQVTFNITSTGFQSPIYGVADAFAHSSLNASVSLNSDGSFHWTPLYNDLGTHALLVSVRDYQNHYASTTVTIVVGGAPSVSVIGALATTPAGQSIIFNATTTNFISPSFAVVDQFYAGSTATSTLSVDAVGHITWAPVYNDIGVHPLTITATDSAGHTASTKVSISVTYPAATVNTPPPSTSTTAAPSSSAVGTQNTPASQYVFRTYLAVGSSGGGVTALQQKLTALGFYGGPVTGYFGNLTAAAVKAFQKSVGLEQVGYVGPGTRAALNK